MVGHETKDFIRSTDAEGLGRGWLKLVHSTDPVADDSESTLSPMSWTVTLPCRVASVAWRSLGGDGAEVGRDDG